MGRVIGFPPETCPNEAYWLDMSWFAAAGRVLLVVAIAAALGALYGFALQAIILALLGLIGFWLYQMQRVQLWLNEPKEAPPDAYGIWGELLARIYFHQRKSSDNQLRLQSTVEYLQSSFASMRDGVVMVDEQGAIKWFNKAVEPLLGLRHPEDTGRTLTNLVRTPEFNQYFLGKDYISPLQFAVGSDRETHLQVEVTHFGEGERLLFVRDVSAAVRIERMRRDFVANVSHELRTPLTVITGYLSTFLDNSQDLPERFTKPLQQMSQQAERMEDLLKDLLWLSRIESDKHEDRSDLLDVGGLLIELQEELNEVYPDSVFEMETETDRKITGNFREIYSAVFNLASNAVKYTDDDSPVTLSWSSKGDKCLLQVRDRGVGIDAIHLPRLTERFYRVDDSRSAITGGTGLGLAIVKHVAAAHDAVLQIESKPGQGSTFTLVFSNRG
jgi:two-component system phosphate regulon sensor histidine kinase PhoR